MRRLALLFVMFAAAAAVLGSTGCESPEARQQQRNSSSSAAPTPVAADAAVRADVDATATDRSDLFAAEITFCRKIGKKSGKRIGVGDRFAIAKRSYVHGLVDFRAVRPHRVYAVHLVWIKPDGYELYRRYAEVVTEPDGDGYATVVNWKKAEDLHYLQQERYTSPDPAFTLESRFNVSRSRQRDLGEYRLQVYLDRRLLLEKSFTLADG